MNLKAVLLLAPVLGLAGCQQGPHSSDKAASADTATADSASAGAPSLVSAERPMLELKTLDGKDFSLADHRGQWVVVNYWATWCGPCLKEMPDLSALHQRRKDLTVIGLAFEDTDAATLSTFLENHPVSYPIAQVDPFQPPLDFAAPRGLPLTYVIDPQGVLREEFLGPVTGEGLERAIERLSTES